MSENNQQNKIVVLPKDRESLYQLVWTVPAEEIALRFGVTVEYLSRQCRELQVPRPMAGYWKAVTKGTPPKRPELPLLRINKVTSPCGQDEATPHLINIKTEQENTLIKTTNNKEIKNTLIKGNQYRLLNEIKSYFSSSPKTKDGYYKPTKKKLLDLTVSDTGFDSALIFLTKFFKALECQGYHALLSERSRHLRRIDLDINEDPRTGRVRWEKLWNPYSPSLICIKDIYVGFSLAEMTEYVPAKEVNGRYIRDERMINWTKGKNASAFGYVSKYTIPTGRFLLQLYSPYDSTDWVEQFRQTKHCGLISQIPKIIETLNKATVKINEQLEEEKRQAEKRRIKWEIERVEYEKREWIHKVEEAHKKSQSELQSIMIQWIEDKRIEQFFQEAEFDALNLSNEQKELVQERIKLARQFLSGDSAIQRLINWKTPQERLPED
ncbi:TPA: hypothetical protein PXN21_002157 [Yersinia enterocolitica]|nr:hypothetical protein [Yersinia enterocolitica]